MSESSPLSSSQDTARDDRDHGTPQPEAVQHTPPAESAEDRMAALAAPSGSPKRAIVGLLLELIGLGAGIYLLTILFQETWMVAATKHWILLGISGLSIIGFLLCVSAMFRQRREAAVLGIWLGIIASISTAVCGTMLLASALELWGTRPTADMIAATEKLLDEIHDEFEAFMNNNNNTPTLAEADALFKGRTDAWGVPLRYHRIDDYEYEILSAGPNQTFDDPDDLRRRRF